MSDIQELFWTLLQPEYRRAALFCRKLTGDRDRGDDLLQDSLVLALEKFGTLKDKGAFKPWLYRIVINCYRGTIRRPWWKRRLPMTPTVEAGMTSADPTPAYTARRLVQTAFSKLSADDRALVTLYELEQWTVAELAQLYRAKDGAIKTRLHRARRRMQEALVNRKRSEIKQTANNESGKCIAVKPETE